MALRDFLFLDRTLVRNFLAQAEGGVVDEATERETAKGKTGFSGRFGISAVGVGAEKLKEQELETEAVVRQVAASEFDRLYQYLDAEGLVVLDEVANLAVLSEIRRKDFVEVDARIRVSGLHKMMSLFSNIGKLAPLMEMFEENAIDPETRTKMDAAAALGGMATSLPVIATVPGAAGLQVALELPLAGVIAEDWDVEASVLLKVQRIIKEGESHRVGDLGGLLKLMPADDLSGLTDSLDSADAARLGIGDSEIVGPGLVGTPVAIYR